MQSQNSDWKRVVLRPVQSNLYLKIHGHAKDFEASAWRGGRVKFRERFYYGIAIVQGHDPPTDPTIVLTPYCNPSEKASSHIS